MAELITLVSFLFRIIYLQSTSFFFFNVKKVKRIVKSVLAVNADERGRFFPLTTGFFKFFCGFQMVSDSVNFRTCLKTQNPVRFEAPENRKSPSAQGFRDFQNPDF